MSENEQSNRNVADHGTKIQIPTMFYFFNCNTSDLEVYVYDGHKTIKKVTLKT